MERGLPLDRPSAFIIEPESATFSRMESLLGATDRRLHVVHGSDAGAAVVHQSQDFWLVQLSTTAPDPLNLCRRLRADHADALLLVATCSAVPVGLGALHSQSPNQGTSS